ncbi:hypothetical protein F2Q69_00031284 [Brassica cretica]|uniref:Uncharacterized protein n=1 Tax=Brassica cretica TaxID=69181 RepID=A0A8S9S771_BRACR|nr:hypothetical protein F2Q69_00031284 [Brassica cretica]
MYSQRFYGTSPCHVCCLGGCLFGSSFGVGSTGSNNYHWSDQLGGVDHFWSIVCIGYPFEGSVDLGLQCSCVPPV